MARVKRISKVQSKAIIEALSGKDLGAIEFVMTYLAGDNRVINKVYKTELFGALKKTAVVIGSLRSNQIVKQDEYYQMRNLFSKVREQNSLPFVSVPFF